MPPLFRTPHSSFYPNCQLSWTGLFNRSDWNSIAPLPTSYVFSLTFTLNYAVCRPPNVSSSLPVGTIFADNVLPFRLLVSLQKQVRFLLRQVALASFDHLILPTKLCISPTITSSLISCLHCLGPLSIWHLTASVWKSRRATTTLRTLFAYRSMVLRSTLLNDLVSRLLLTFPSTLLLLLSFMNALVSSLFHFIPLSAISLSKFSGLATIKLLYAFVVPFMGPPRAATPRLLWWILSAVIAIIVPLSILLVVACF